MVSAQAHALRAAARFIERAGLTGLSVTADHDGQLIIAVRRRAGPAPARAGMVAALAAAVGAPGPARIRFRSMSWVSAAGTLAGHPARVTTTISDQEEQEQNP